MHSWFPLSAHSQSGCTPAILLSMWFQSEQQCTFVQEHAGCALPFSLCLNRPWPETPFQGSSVWHVPATLWSVYTYRWSKWQNQDRWGPEGLCIWNRYRTYVHWTKRKAESKKRTKTCIDMARPLPCHFWADQYAAGSLKAVPPCPGTKPGGWAPLTAVCLETSSLSAEGLGFTLEFHSRIWYHLVFIETFMFTALPVSTSVIYGCLLSALPATAPWREHKKLKEMHCSCPKEHPFILSY